MDRLSSDIQTTLAPFHAHTLVVFSRLTVRRAASQRCARLPRDGWTVTYHCQRAGGVALHSMYLCTLQVGVTSGLSLASGP